jgi:hypothetical protein
MVFLALTFGQEVGRFIPGVAISLRMGLIGWAILGEWIPISKECHKTMSNSRQGQRWSLMAILYLTVCSLCSNMHSKLCWREHILDTLCWNRICHVCVKAKNLACAHQWSHIQPQDAEYVTSHSPCLFLLTGGIQPMFRQFHSQIQWVFYTAGSHSRLNSWTTV